jgi:drug/metabolite transporter (DMT)-like permease
MPVSHPPPPAAGFTRSDAGLLVVSLIWGANFTALKYALGELPPFGFAAARFILACGLLWIAVRALERPSPIPRRVLAGLVLLGIIGNTGYQVAFMTGLERTTATNASLIMAAMPVMVAGLATATGVERPGSRLWIGMLLASAGVVLVIAARGIELSLDRWAGDLLVLLAAFCWAVFTVGVRRIGTSVSPLQVTAITTYAGAPGLLLLGWSELRGVSWGSLRAGTWFGLLYSAVFAIGIAYVLWNQAVKRIGSSRTAIYNCVIPVVAGLVAWVVLGEDPGPGQLAGAALVIAGVLLSQTGGPPRRVPTPVVPDIPD